MNQLGAMILMALPIATLLTMLSGANRASEQQLNDALIADDHHVFYNSSALVSRSKRQYTCPPGCYPSCQTNQQCQQFAPRMVCIQACCCPLSQGGISNYPNINIIPIPIIPINPANTFGLANACDGGAAVAACINGLCGQGYFCNSRGFCCRCVTGNSTGPCINNLCPAGYACNTNNFCCPLGSGSVLGPCINGQCPTGYTCGAGNLCYSVAINNR